MKRMARALAFCLALLFCCPAWAESSEEEVACLMQAADSLHAMGRSDSAIVVAGRALQQAERSRNPGLVLTVSSSLGVYLRSTGRVDEALKCYDRALKIATTREFREHADEEACEEAASLYVNVAVLHVDMAHKELAAGYARKAAGWARQCSDAAFRAQIYGVVGSVFTFAGLPDEAGANPHGTPRVLPGRVLHLPGQRPDA